MSNEQKPDELQRVREAIYDRLQSDDDDLHNLDWNIGFIDGLRFALQQISTTELNRLKERA
jgi:hypothetical protein